MNYFWSWHEVKVWRTSSTNRHRKPLN